MSECVSVSVCVCVCVCACVWLYYHVCFAPRRRKERENVARCGVPEVWALSPEPPEIE